MECVERSMWRRRGGWGQGWQRGGSECALVDHYNCTGERRGNEEVKYQVFCILCEKWSKYVAFRVNEVDCAVFSTKKHVWLFHINSWSRWPNAKVRQWGFWICHHIDTLSLIFLLLWSPKSTNFKVSPFQPSSFSGATDLFVGSAALQVQLLS